MKVKIAANSCNSAADCLRKFEKILELYNPKIEYSEFCEHELIIEIKSLKELSYFTFILGHEILIENSDFEENQLDFLIMD